MRDAQQIEPQTKRKDLKLELMWGLCGENSLSRFHIFISATPVYTATCVWSEAKIYCSCYFLFRRRYKRLDALLQSSLFTAVLALLWTGRTRPLPLLPPQKKRSHERSGSSYILCVCVCVWDTHMQTESPNSLRSEHKQQRWPLCAPYLHPFPLLSGLLFTSAFHAAAFLTRKGSGSCSASLPIRTVRSNTETTFFCQVKKCKVDLQNQLAAQICFQAFTPAADSRQDQDKTIHGSLPLFPCGHLRYCRKRIIRLKSIFSHWLQYKTTLPKWPTGRLWPQMSFIHSFKSFYSTCRSAWHVWMERSPGMFWLAK